MNCLISVCFILIISVQVFANDTSVERVKFVNVKAYELNVDLRDLYRKSLDGTSADTADITRLRADLGALKELHSEIDQASGAKGAGIERIIRGARRFRALAWLHAWTTFNQLIYQASRPEADPTLRTDLILLSDDATSSVLELLLSTYTQIGDTEQNQANPLQQLLAEDDQLSHLLAYREAWLDEAEKTGAGVKHKFYIPSSEDILGKSGDMITGQKIPRNLLTIWGLVNLQLDTWHHNRRDPRDGSILPASTIQNESNLSDLGNWLLDSSVEPLGHIGSADAKTKFRSRVRKLGLFVQWRHKYSSETELSTYTKALYDARTTGGNLAAAFGDLLEAAKPDAGQVLPDAGYWARYTYLLSLKMPRRALLTPQQTEVVEANWETLGIGKFLVERPNVGARPGFLRWNQEPANGNIASLLSDLTNATWKLFAFERGVRSFDSEQFTGINRSLFSSSSSAEQLNSLKSYSTRLDQRLANLRLAFRRFVEPYFSPPGFVATGLPMSETSYYQKLSLALPVRLSTADDEYTASFRGSSIVREQDRIIRDFITIAGEIRSALLLYGVVRDAYNDANNAKDVSSVGYALQDLPSGIPFSSAQIYQLPDLTWQEYLNEFDRHINTLKQHVKLVSAKSSLRAEYRSKRERLLEAQLRLKATRVGTRVIEKAKAISENYRKIADIGAEIAALDKEVRTQEKLGWESSENASNKKLAQVERLRDLAAAQVDALKEVAQQAVVTIDQQVKDLEGLKAEFIKLKTEKEKEEQTNRIIAVIKTAVNVIGLALAPFTSGASLSVASMVNNSIDVYQQLSRVNWNNFGDAVIGIGKAAESISRIVETGVNTFGSESARKTLAEAKVFLNEKRGELTAAAETTRRLLEAIGNLPKDDISNIAIALSNGQNIDIGQNGKVSFNFGDKKIVFKHEGLKNDLRNLLDAGGMVVNDLRIRNSDLIKLPEITDNQEFRRKLSESLDIISKQLPPELFDKWKAQGEVIKKQKEEQFKNAVSKLKSRVEDVNTSITDLRIFGQAVVGGWLVISDQETTVSIVAPPLTKEAAVFKARLENYKKATVSAKMNDLIQRFQSRRNTIIAAADKASSSSAALGEVAASIPGYIDQTRADAIAIGNELELAQEKLEETKEQVEIAYYDAEANRAFREASGLRLKQADEQIRRAALEQEQAALHDEMELLRAEQQNFEVQGAVHSLRAAEIDFKRTYEACLQAGIDPLADEASELSQDEIKLRADHNRFGIVPAVAGLAMVPPSPNSLRSLLAGYELDDNANFDRLAIAKVADDLIGLMQWLSVVSTSDENPKPSDFFARTVSHAIYDSPTVAAEGFENVKSEVAELYLKRARQRMQVKFAEDITTSITRINWLLNMPETFAETFVKNYGIPETTRPYVMGYIRFRFRHDGGVDTGQTLYKSLGPPNNAYYIDTNQMFVACSDCANMRFIPIPPLKPVPNLGAMPVGKTGPELFQNDKDIFISLNTAQTKTEIQQKLGVPEKLTLTGAMGPSNDGASDWTILILDPTSKTDAQKRAFIKQFEQNKTVFSFVVGYLEVNPAKKVH